MTEEQVVLVSPEDEALGLMGKTEAHEKGVLHKAISVLIFNSRNQMLLQQRADSKYHWAGIWSNSACSHPRDGETYQAAAERRLFEELGFNTPLAEQFHFIYKAEDAESGLTEHELDHVFFGTYDGEVKFNEDEVKAVRWIDIPTLLMEMKDEPDRFSFWFHIIMKEIDKRRLI